MAFTWGVDRMSCQLFLSFHLPHFHVLDFYNFSVTDSKHSLLPRYNQVQVSEQQSISLDLQHAARELQLQSPTPSVDLFLNCIAVLA